MKKILIWLGLLVAVVALVYLVDQGLIRWQPLTVVVAALLAPLKFVAGFFGNDEDKIRAKHRRRREEEATFQAEVEAEVERRTRRVQDLSTEVRAADTELQRLQGERAALQEDIAGESADRLAERFRDAVG